MPTFPLTVAFRVERYLGGVRVDTFLIRHLRNYTSARMQRMVRAGLVRVDDIVAQCEQRVFPGQRVAVSLVEPPDKLIAPEPLPLNIVYEDPWLVVVDKPAGQIVHQVGDFQTGTLTNALQHHLDRQTWLRGLLRPGIVHRLDRQTSGLIIACKDHLSHRLLSIAFQERRVAKQYLAVVEGLVADDQQMIDLPIGQHAGRETILMSSLPDALRPRPARTMVRVLERRTETTLIAARPLTGRLHQIRVHLAAIGHPVLGDEFYAAGGEIRASRFDVPRLKKGISSPHAADSATGTSAETGPSSEIHSDGDDLPVMSEAEEVGRHFLHASRLSFQHPVTEESMTIAAEAPAEFH